MQLFVDMPKPVDLAHQQAVSLQNGQSLIFSLTPHEMLA